MHRSISDAFGAMRGVRKQFQERTASFASSSTGGKLISAHKEYACRRISGAGGDGVEECRARFAFQQRLSKTGYKRKERIVENDAGISPDIPLWSACVRPQTQIELSVLFVYTPWHFASFLSVHIWHASSAQTKGCAMITPFKSFFMYKHSQHIGAILFLSSVL